jgi:hypothetical protein
MAALGRALEHLGGLSAFAGWILRLPGINQLAELASLLLPFRRIAIMIAQRAR